MKIKYFSGLFLAVILNLAVFPQQGDNAQIDPKAAKYYNKSIESLKASNFTEADAYIDSAIAISKDPRFIFIKGDIAFRQSNWDKAIAQYEEYVKTNKDNDVAYVQLAKAYYNAKQYPKAVEANNQVIAITKDPQKKADAEGRIKDIQNIDAIEHYNAGTDLSKNGKYDEALAEFDKAIAISKDAKFYYSKGVTYSKMQKPAEAEKEFKTAISIDPNLDLAYYMLGGVYYTAKNYKDALPVYQKALEVSQNEALKNNIKESMKIAYLQLGIASYKEKKYDAAIESFNKANELVPYDQAYLWTGKALTEKKKYDDALTAYNKALENKKTVTEGMVSYYIGSMYKAKGDKAKAIEYFKKGLTDETVKKACQSEITAFNAAKDTAPKKK